MKIHSLCIFVLIALSIGAVVATDKLRGIKPSSTNIYQGEYIECDGGKKVLISRVNDEFCDCKDGKDEPGTSACPQGHFFCTNVGFRGTSIPSGWVDDGRCDCCDGSDEAKVRCPNTCEEASKKHKEKVASETAVAERGLALREAYVAHAQSERTRHLQLITEAEAKQAALEAKVAELEKVKVAAEEAYSAIHDKVEERMTSERDAKKEQKEVVEGEEKEEDREKEEALLVDEDPEVKPLKEAAVSHTPVHNYYAGYEEEDGEGELTFWEMLLLGYADLFETIQSTWRSCRVMMMGLFTPQTDKEKAVQAWSDAKNEKDSANRELEGYRKFVNLDFGHEGAFHALYGKVEEFSDKEYTYKLDAFNEIRQTKSGHSSNLGRWKGWDESKPNVMLYENGDRCWGAPDRSTKVTFICGDEHKIIDVKEPNKCEYSMLVKSPAACSKVALEEL